MKISIIIRCKDEQRHIGRVLVGVFSQGISYPYEVIVVDSGSTDETLAIVSHYDCKVIRIKPEDFTYGYAMNVGAREATGDILVYLSAHCPPVDARWLALLVMPFAEDDVAGVYGRQAPLPGGNPFDEWRLERAFPEFGGKTDRYMFSSANAAVRRSFWEEFPFDEKLPFSEDRQWAKTVIDKGHRIEYAKDSVVYHSHYYSLKGVRARAHAAGFAKKSIYGPGCRFDSKLWIAGAYAYCVAKDASYFISNGLWEYLKEIPYYRYLELSGFYQGAKAAKKAAINGRGQKPGAIIGGSGIKAPETVAEPAVIEHPPARPPESPQEQPEAVLTGVAKEPPAPAEAPVIKKVKLVTRKRHKRN